MIRGHEIPNDRLYEPVHIDEVLADMEDTFRDYFNQFAPDKLHLFHKMNTAMEEFERERPKYLELLDRAYLAEFEYDPSAFRSTLRRDCPIIRRCLNSPAKIMDDYRAKFNLTSSNHMLKIVTNISEYAAQFMPSFKADQQLIVRNPKELNVTDLDGEDYTAHGMIGGGIRSHFLYNLHPIAFPNRSQNAIWAYYFLSKKKDYGFEDDSEFLMIYPDGSGTQQNYFYPYDLFTYYAIKLFLLLEAGCERLGYELNEQFRYLYLNTFLDFIADLHRVDINTLKPVYEQFDY